MVEKKMPENHGKRERFEFVLTINGNIICQRYFHINGFNDKSLGSVELTDAIEVDCFDLINNDLKRKSRIYLHEMCPQVFKNKAEMDAWVRKQTFEIKPIAYVILDDSDDVYVWDGEKMHLYDKTFNRSSFYSDDTQSNVIKLAFCDNGREVRSYAWDANVYPKFVRNNIDLSNSKNKYADEDSYSPVEKYLIDCFNEGGTDIIPAIVRTICDACSLENGSDYSHTLVYGDKVYDLNINAANRRYMKKMEALCRKKYISNYKGD